MNENFEQEKKWILKEKYGVKDESFLDSGKIKDFSTNIEKLKNGEPLAFLIGFVEFLNCKINLEFKPLIPRVETEFWVHEFIKKELKKKSEKIKILDIFSGSGCIGISLLKNLKDIEVDFSEINPDFIKQIEKNLKINFPNSKKTCKIFQSDVFKNIPPEKYDFIFANPPYIPKNKKIDRSVKNFEDYDSLFAEDDGLFFIKKIILESRNFLKKNGKILIEFDESSKKNIKKFLQENNIKEFDFQKDQFNNDRVLIISF